MRRMRVNGRRLRRIIRKGRRIRSINRKMRGGIRLRNVPILLW